MRQKYGELDRSREFVTYCTNDSRGMAAAVATGADNGIHLPNLDS